MVFIPLGFATSFLGMNVEQFGTGKIHIKFFFLAAALAGGIAIALTLMVKPLDRAMNASRERVSRLYGLDTEQIGTRDILRESKIGQRVIDAMTITDSNGGRIYDDFFFRQVFRNWCGFPFRKLWASVKRTRSPKRSTEA